MLALGLFLLPLAVRAEDTDGKLSKAKEKYDTDKDGKLSAEEKARAREDAAAHDKAKEAEQRKEVLQKYDANGNGQLDESEKAKIKADEAARIEKYRQELARYDANHNGKLDPDELAKMRDDEQAAAKTANQAAKADAQFERKMEKLRGGNPPPKVRKH